MSTRPLRVAVVAGEESGDLLAADLVRALQRRAGRPVELVGVGGRHLEALGLSSMVPASEIALMGVSAVIRDLPRLVLRISSVAREIAAAQPDCLVTVDVPDFSLRVARKVKERAPSLPVIHYVCPSVWAWRPSRAPAMRAYVDHVLCLLPFEPAELARLGGPPGTFVGHRLTRDPDLLAARGAKRDPSGQGPRQLLVLPGSRGSEVSRLLPPFGETVRILKERGNAFEVSVPTVPHVAALVEDACRGWPVATKVFVDPQDKWAAFGRADAALAASGTVLLELALARVPMISCYRLDVLGRLASRLITTWSAALPNLVAGWPAVPEYYDDQVRPEHLARLIEQLWDQTPMRLAQLDAFDKVTRTMATGTPAGEIAAGVVLAATAE